MAHHVEAMDVDSDFDNKENSLHHSNVLPFTEKGYEELDVSELNMKLRYSVTPASSPMSKSYTANCLDNRSVETDDPNNVNNNENSNLTRSLNSTMTKNDSVVKSLKALPLQTINTEQFDNNRTTVLRPTDSTISIDSENVTVTISGPEMDENLSLPSTSSSAVHTPEATTPTNTQKSDGGSPIMRGLKTVLNMFRSSQSPIPTTESESMVKPDILSPAEPTRIDDKTSAMLVSTPIAAHRKKETIPTKLSPQKDSSLVFNEDLEKELQWKDETTILFSQEKIPIHKLFFQPHQAKNPSKGKDLPKSETEDNLDSTVEYMDISCNESIRDKTIMNMSLDKLDVTTPGESDGEFVDCETTFTKNESIITENDKTPMNDKTQDLDSNNDQTPINDRTQDFDVTQEEIKKENTSASRLKQIILNTTQDILDATLSITPEDLLPEALDKTKDIPDKVNSQIPGDRSEIEIRSVILDETVSIAASTKINIDKVNPQISEDRLLPEALDKTKDIPDKVNPQIPEHRSEIEIRSVILDETVSIAPSTAINTDKASIPNMNETIDIVNPVNKEQTEDPNSTKISEKADQPLLNQTINVTKPAINESKRDPNITKTIDDISTNNVPVLAEKLDSTFVTAPAFIDKTFDQEASILPSNTENKSVLEGSQDNKETRLNTTQILTSTCPVLEDTSNKSISDEKIDVSTVKEASMTDLPDEDDFEQDENVPIDVVEEAIVPTNLSLDLVDDIKVQAETTDSILNIPPEGANVIEAANNIEKDVVAEMVLPGKSHIDEGGDTLQTEKLDTQLVEGVIDDVKVEPQLGEATNLPVASHITPLNVEAKSETNVDIAKGLADLKVVPKAEVNQTLNVPQPVVSMDINESIHFTPLPDVINQTITTSNIENVNVPDTVIEQLITSTTYIVTNVANQENKVEDLSTPVTGIVSDVNTTITVEDKTDCINTTAVAEETNDKPVNEPETCTSENVTLTPEIIAIEIPSETVPLKETQQDTDKMEEAYSKTKDEEIVASENNSPFVSVSAEDLPEELTKLDQEVEECFIADEFTYNQPASPPITSKGYNFNFDEIDDPFATKTKIRLSPPVDSPTKTIETKKTASSVERPSMKKETENRRKTQSERKKPVAPKRKLNSTFDGKLNEQKVDVDESAVGDVKLKAPEQAQKPSDITNEEDKIMEEANLLHEETLNLTKQIHSELDKEKEETIEQPIPTTEVEPLQTDIGHSDEHHTTSSSELSTYFSAGTSSSESNHPRNVFNLPEIDDVNFNPFATKSNIRLSPSPSFEIDNPFATKCKITNSTETTVISVDKNDIEFMEKDLCSNASFSTTSSKALEEGNLTTREVNTEDEDTVEGPFLEAEDLNADDKMSDFDGENIDMMQFNELPPQASEENVDPGELFIDAEAFEFLLNQNKTNTVADSGKESLFLKFDPLFAKRMSAVTSDTVVAALSKIHKRQSTPTKAPKSPQSEVISPVAGTSNLNVTQDMDMSVSEDYSDDLNITVAKPMMVVPPAVNPVTPRNKSITPNRSNRRSITFTSPAMAVIDRLLSLSGNNSLVHDTTVQQVSREQNEADIALTQLRELLAEKEIHVYSLRNESKELKDRLASMESYLKNLEDESQERLKKIDELNGKLSEKTKINKSMAAVVEEYERTIASLIAETAQDKKRHAEERIRLINERDEQTAHLASMEVSFSDLHSKYEKSKQVILNCKANEDAYKKSIKEFEENLIKMKKNYELLKQHATSKLNHANQELEKMNRTHEAEVLKLNAMIKRKELHITSLEESLAQKTKANEELTAICDELINKVG